MEMMKKRKRNRRRMRRGLRSSTLVEVGILHTRTEKGTRICRGTRETTIINRGTRRAVIEIIMMRGLVETPGVMVEVTIGTKIEETEAMRGATEAMIETIETTEISTRGGRGVKTLTEMNTRSERPVLRGGRTNRLGT